MRYYDERGRRVPARRTDRSGEQGAWVIALLLIGTIAALGFAGYLAAVDVADVAEQRPDPTAHVVTHDSLTANHTYDGEVIRWYVMTDPDTGVEYLVNDRGGCCVREVAE